MTVKYRGFLSYSHADSKVARRLHRWLEAYRMPRRLVGRETPFGHVPSRLHPIFRDREELPTSADLGSQIDAALRDSMSLVVLCSPKAASSRWVNEEILAFKRLGRADRILCLIIEGEPNATDKPGLEAAECFPPALRYQLGDDGELSDVPAEPIAADMRQAGDGRRNAFLKLAAGLAGVGFDELRQREMQRQLRRAATVSITSLVLVITMAGLAVAALLARHEAVRQQAIAEQERDRAEENFREARDAVDHFYTKVAEEDLLRAEGLQPLRKDLLEQALDYYRRFLLQRDGDVAFAVDTAEVRGNVAAILSEVASPADALAAAAEATATLERLYTAGAPPRITVKLAASLTEEALNLDRLGRTDEALPKAVRAIGLLEPVSNGSPDEVSALIRRLWGMRGAFEARLGQFDDAASSYQRSLAMAAESASTQLVPLGFSLQGGDAGVVIVGVAPGSPAEAAGLEVGDVLASVAGIEIEGLEDWPRIKERLQAGVASPVVADRGGRAVECEIVPVRVGELMTAAAKYNLGYLYLERMGQAEMPRPWLEDAVDEFRRTLMRGDSVTPDVRQGLASAASALAACGLRLGDKNLYERGTREAARAAEENVNLNPAVPAFHSAAGVHTTNLSSLLWRQERLDEAATACERAVGYFRKALETGGNLPSDRFQLFQALTNLALIRSSQAGAEAAIPIYEAAIEVSDGLNDPANPTGTIALARLRRNYASSLRNAGRIEDAARQYDAAAVAYRQMPSSVEPDQAAPDSPYHDEAAQLESWRAAAHAMCGDRDAESRALTAFEDACRALASDKARAPVVVALRVASVEAWCDAVTRTTTVDPARASAMMARAESELRAAEAAARDGEGLADAIEKTRQRVESTAATLSKSSER